MVANKFSLASKKQTEKNCTTACKNYYYNGFLFQERLDQTLLFFRINAR